VDIANLPLPPLLGARGTGPPCTSAAVLVQWSIVITYFTHTHTSWWSSVTTLCRFQCDVAKVCALPSARYFKYMTVLCGMPTVQYSARGARFFKLNDLHISTSLSSVMTDMSRHSLVDRHCLSQRYVPNTVNSHLTSH